MDFRRLALPIARAAISLSGLVLLLCGCSGETETKATACVPGRSIACNGAEGCAGHQICQEDGAAYDVCVCSGDETFPSAGRASGLLGAQCADDSDCRKGFSCLTSTSEAIVGEGPSAGLCVLDCARDESVCEATDAGTLCVMLDDGGTSGAADDVAFCLPRCTLGDPGKNDDKCRGRIDQVCSQRTAGTDLGYCRPACRSDVDCGKRQCNLSTGLCGDAPPTGEAIGSTCDPLMSQCSGGCVEHGADYFECSGVCSLGTPGCGQETADGPPYDFWCYLDPSNQGGQGDLGYCARLCDCNADCGREDAVCEPRPSLAETGRKGVCGPATFASGGARPNLPCP